MKTVQSPFSEVSGICKNCNKRKADTFWSESMMHFVHGVRAMWCYFCVYTEQIKAWEKQLQELPERIKDAKQKLAEYTKFHADPSPSDT